MTKFTSAVTYIFTKTQKSMEAKINARIGEERASEAYNTF
jgi:hypothetical protein